MKKSWKTPKITTELKIKQTQGTGNQDGGPGDMGGSGIGMGMFDS